MISLKFSILRLANTLRLPLFTDATGKKCHKATAEGPAGFDWALSQWSNAVFGEAGEAANIIKKIERGDFPLEDARPALADELADVAIYLDLLAYRAGIDLGEAIVNKFNRKSEEKGIDVRIKKYISCTVDDDDFYIVSLAGKGEQ